jgi:hypothetical protein
MNIKQEILRIAKTLSASFRYQIVYKDATGVFHNDKYSTIGDLKKAAKKMGAIESGRETSKYVRPELQGQPRFNIFIGPIWGGNNTIRYEDQQTYDILST